MHGYSHAMTGAAAWAAVTSSSSAALGLYAAPPGVMLAGTFLCAGAAIAPDADHARASIAHSLPPASGWLASGVGFVSGGHRHGTHSFIGVAAYTGVAFLASLWVVSVGGRVVAVGSALMAVLLAAFATKVLGVHKGFGKKGLLGLVLGSVIGPWLLSLALVGAITWRLDHAWTWLPLCMAIGCYVHILGDSLTYQGVPWLWPWNPRPPKVLRNAPVVGRVVRFFWADNGYFRIPILGKTGEDRNWREGALVALVGVYMLYLAVYEVFDLAGQSSMLF